MGVAACTDTADVPGHAKSSVALPYVTLAPFLMTPDQRSALMLRVRGKDTEPELAVLRVAHSWGFRFLLHSRSCRGGDLVFPRLGKAVLVHGCFWHRHQDPNCHNAVAPKTRAEWWQTKLSANVARDARNLKALEELGLGGALTLWECEIRSGVSSRGWRLSWGSSLNNGRSAGRMCQSASKTDPLSASKIDPSSRRLVAVVHRGDPRGAECPSRG